MALCRTLMSLSGTGFMWLHRGNFYAILAMLFGVGLTISLDKQPLDKALRYSAARLLILFLIGLIHAYLVFSGDILYHYSVIGSLALLILVLGPRAIKAAVIMAVCCMLLLGYNKAERNNEQYQAYQEAINIDSEDRTWQQRRAVKRWLERTEPDTPTHRPLRSESTFAKAWWDNFQEPQVHRGTLFYRSIFWSTLMMMLVGSLLYQAGLFQAKRLSSKALMICSLVLLASLYATHARYFHWLESPQTVNLSYLKSMLMVFNRELQAIIYLVLLVIVYNRWLAKVAWLKLVNQVGRFALSNYLLQSLVLLLIFHGAGFYNQFSRSELLLLWLGLLGLQLLANILYGRYYSMGPVEWSWRWLTAKLARQTLRDDH